MIASYVASQAKSHQRPFFFIFLYICPQHSGFLFYSVFVSGFVGLIRFVMESLIHLVAFSDLLFHGVSHEDIFLISVLNLILFEDVQLLHPRQIFFSEMDFPVHLIF